MQTLQASDGIALHLQEWPAPEAARGTVLIVHGLGEHIGRYGTVAGELNAAGWNVAGYDHRGHGRSDGKRGRIAQDDSMLRDLSAVIDHFRERFPGPLVLLGHSMGGLVVGRFVAEGVSSDRAAWSRDVDALVMSSPALDPGMSAFQKFLVATLGALAPDLGVGNGLKPEWISRDPAVVAAYMADPLVHDRISPRLARFIVTGGEVARSRASSWHVPTLLMWAGADRCVAPSGSAEFAAAAPRYLVGGRAFDGLYHEIFNEPERGEVVRMLLDWLDQRAR
jgi:alpha-beta hydrolase superfamily lysophospholipase